MSSALPEIRWSFFDRQRPITLARAPGRLDVMGGIADYSGALVLEMPIVAATWVAAQPSTTPEVVIESDDIRALGGEATVTIPLAEISPERPLTYERARALLTADPRRAWAAYAAGALVVLHADVARPLRHGLRLLVWSEVPVGKGLSSSAALEVATLEAVAPLLGASLADRDVALLAQKVENFVVGAPCGVMDQMTSSCGSAGQLLPLLCQPAELEPCFPIPDGLAFWGIDLVDAHGIQFDGDGQAVWVRGAPSHAATLRRDAKRSRATSPWRVVSVRRLCLATGG